VPFLELCLCFVATKQVGALHSATANLTCSSKYTGQKDTPTLATHPHSRNIKTDLAAAVFHSVYTSRTQRQRRLLAGLILTTKHTLRGLLFSWPLYLMALGGFYAPFPVDVLLWAIAVPGIGLSLAILIRGVHAAYSEHVTGKIQRRGDLARLFWRE